MSEVLTRRFIEAMKKELDLTKAIPEDFFQTVHKDIGIYVDLSPTTEHRVVDGEANRPGEQALTLFMRTVARHFLAANLAEIDWDDVEFIMRREAAAAKKKQAYLASD